MIATWQGRRAHKKAGRFVLGIIGALSLACGVIFLHGPPAMTMIYAGAITLVIATLWNVWARRVCAAVNRFGREPGEEQGTQ